MTAIDRELQAQVNAQLLEQGAFTPLELLFSSGRLAYGDYDVLAFARSGSRSAG